MNRTQMIKQAYVRGLAARGILRARMLQKQAGGGLGSIAIAGPEPAPGDVSSINGGFKPLGSLKELFNDGKPVYAPKPWSRGATNAIAGLGGAGIGAIIGALIAYARKKKVLGHALAGAGIGGVAGVGGNELYRYLTATPERSLEDLNLTSSVIDGVTNSPNSGASAADVLGVPVDDSILSLSNMA